jgi:hypothetical protein
LIFYHKPGDFSRVNLKYPSQKVGKGIFWNYYFVVVLVAGAPLAPIIPEPKGMVLYCLG